MKSESQLEKRQRKILIAVVCSYISSAEPVGSRTIARKYDFGISPATIRNIMADLEESGFLAQPHTSAGRVPTDKGFRFYVDHLKHSLQSLEHITSFNIEDILHNEAEIGNLMKKTTDLLSRLSHQAGLMLAPNLKNTVCRHIDFIKLNNSQTLVIFISESGHVHKRVIRLGEDISQDTFDQMSRLITNELMGLSLTKIRSKLMDMLSAEKIKFDALYARAVKLSQQFFDEEVDESELYLGGTFNMMNHPEFADIEKIKALFQAFEEKRILLSIIDKCLEEELEGAKVIIGEENSVVDMQDLSFVLSSYNYGERLLGVVGVIGPKRMDYTQVIPMVEYTAKTISRLLTNRIES
ncbi:heat-inducible transcription repressor HrcA [candidate division KSB3 bacterium]|uniref:Heat-inducible transcription repressor HrcA n=1 Tax=candidate division KSB3 bacterium TaxID=2044937 RepID=A0A2G6E5P6_9BACT|nr:MAG: heat-inducible transcription repressor HrcA [candidate division KSB3 bacterium]PIE29731.1 MAG: heat-inducible transcription repressor HrcA [candidate division KSB3 bacterium]